MRNILCAFLLFFLVPHLRGNEAVKAFIDQLSSKEKTTLNQFLEALCQRFGGYVLYGDKPISLWGYSLQAMSSPKPGKYVLPLIEGKKLWQKLKISAENKEFPLIIIEHKNYIHFICINRRAFLNVVNENISLFRYILGSTLTAEGLLSGLIKEKDQFYNVLNNDVLIGILLGYGTDNAILYAREECIRVSKANAKKTQSLKPSFGFSTISEEARIIEQMLSSSHSFKPLDDYQLPYFGCVSDSDETQTLMSNYKKNKEALLQAVKSDTFLENTLQKLLTTTSQTIDIP